MFKVIQKKYGITPASLIGLGHIQIARKDYPGAKAYFENAIKGDNPWIRDIDFKMAYLGLAWVEANEQRHKESIHYYEEVLKLDSLNMLALLGMGNAYNWLKEYDKAESYFNRVLKIEPDNEYALAALGTVYLNRGNSQTSEKLLEQSLKINNKTYSCPYEGLGMLYFNQGKTKEAEASFKKAIAINPDIEYRKYNGLAKIYIKQGRIKEAKELLEKSIKNYPYDNEAKQILKEIGD
jgi:tetratricopeptide (TPR) repeat protein